MTLKRELYELLEGGDRSARSTRLVDGGLCLLIVTNVLAVALESVPAYQADYGAGFLWFELVSLVIFTVEYALRLWVCTEHPPLQRLPAFRARQRYALSPFMIIDFVAIAATVAAAATGLDLRALRVFRLLRLLKLARYSPAIITLGRVLYDERRSLGATLVIMFGLLMLSASIISILEAEAQPEDFGTIPAAMWWAMATLTTVGYGDVVPVTAMGRIFGGIVTMLGIAMYALPIAIIASGFTNEFNRRDFVVTWGMVAKVPLFNDLEPVAVAKVAGLLRSRLIPPGYEIVHKGEPADCMYFIVSGDVAVDLGDRRISLGEGDYFGEIALLFDTKRTASATAVTECKLMILMRHDFNGLLETEPELKRAFQELAAERMREVLPDSSDEGGAGGDGREQSA